MKANRKFVQADEAVSPVIAVILMVAITVVLAATVFVLVQGIGSQTASSAPSINFATDDNLDRLRVNTAATPADWNRLEVRVVSGNSAPMTALFVGSTTECTNTTNYDCHNLAALSTGRNIFGNAADITDSADAVRAEDFLAFCKQGGTTPSGQVVIAIIDTVANQKVGDYTFSSLNTCLA
jgi:flagellin-like protein